MDIENSFVEDFDVFLSTSDNPFCPYEDFENWLKFDEHMNYNTCGYVARVANTSDDNSDADNELETYVAIMNILALNITGNYVLKRRPETIPT